MTTTTLQQLSNQADAIDARTQAVLTILAKHCATYRTEKDMQVVALAESTLALYKATDAERGI